MSDAPTVVTSALKDGRRWWIAAAAALAVGLAILSVRPHPPGAPAAGTASRGAQPLVVDTALRARPEERRGVYDLTPGNPATFAVTRERVSESRIRQMLVPQPYDLLAVVV
ncbi:hypothetical protein E1292_07855 [Nonomuraea deserti]|uniref:Uncharacterized protein n=1 Tax=Nonomuraea deserti TaxID=1848322 RepID=A0A4R4WAS1_9ACTN|nr:hypothetical protein [Nonomuraea deserti]TDD10410.1 hypothetical protein E1292_07855 [Nonomuraea deserti]